MSGISTYQIVVREVIKSLRDESHGLQVSPLQCLVFFDWSAFFLLNIFATEIFFALIAKNFLNKINNGRLPWNPMTLVLKGLNNYTHAEKNIAHANHALAK